MSQGGPTIRHYERLAPCEDTLSAGCCPMPERTALQESNRRAPRIDVFRASTPVLLGAAIVNFGHDLNLHCQGAVTRLDGGLVYDQSEGQFRWRQAGGTNDAERFTPFAKFLSPLGITSRFLDRFLLHRAGQVDELSGAIGISGEEILSLHRAMRQDELQRAALRRDPLVRRIVNHILGVQREALFDVTSIETYAFKREVLRDMARVATLIASRLGRTEIAIAGILVDCCNQDRDFREIVIRAGSCGGRSRSPSAA